MNSVKETDRIPVLNPRSTCRVLLILAPLLFFLALLLAPADVRAAPTFTVNSTADAVDANPGDGKCETSPGNGICTLRAAVMEANHTAGGGATINFDPRVAILNLTIPAAPPDDERTGALKVTAPMNILGNGVNATIIVGGYGNLLDPAIETFAAGVNISGIVIELAGTPSTQGGGILNFGTLTLTRSFIFNSRGYAGGGIYNYLNAKLTVVQSSIGVNTAAAGGGGGILNAGSVNLIDSIVASNATSASGGGIANAGTLIAVNSTISENSADQNGGGIWTIPSSSAQVSLFNVTVTSNQADHDANGSGTGGGIFNSSGGTVMFKNTILAGNSETAPGPVPGTFIGITGECSGTVNSVGFNLMQNFNTSNCTVTGVMPPLVDPKLGLLADNGGPTDTHALLAGSPAIDAGDPAGCTDNTGARLTTDQRGLRRPWAPGGRCDIGAFEYGAMPPLYLPLIMR